MESLTGQRHDRVQTESHELQPWAAVTCRAFKLSSNWQFFHQECERLKMVFARLHYPETLIENTIRHFIEMRDTENVCSKQQAGADTGGVDRVDIHPPFFSKKKIEMSLYLK